MSQPLVKGGVLENQQYGYRVPIPEGIEFPNTVPSEIDPNAIIIGVTHPSISKADPWFGDGWFISDFYAWNLLVKGLGSRQTWLSTADPYKLVDRWGDFLQGDPSKDGRKVVLSKNLLDRGQISIPTIVKHGDMKRRFLDEVTSATVQGAKEGHPVILFMFCHGTPDFKLNLDSNQRQGVMPSELSGAIGDRRCRVIVITTACYSGGWIVKDYVDCPPDVGMLAAADGEHLSIAWSESKTIRQKRGVNRGRTSGGVFTSAVITALASPTSSPLLTTETSLPESAGPSTTSHTQDDEYSPSYNSFSNDIQDTLSEICGTSDHHQFIFGAVRDQFAASWDSHVPFQRELFRSRWEALETRQGNLPSEADWKRIEPGNAPRTAGSGDDIKKAYDACSERGDLRGMARIFRSACPGTWYQAKNVHVRAVLDAFIEFGMNREDYAKLDSDSEEDSEDDEDPFSKWTIEELLAYRWELALVVDEMVRKFKLPLPDDKVCILWNEYDWEKNAKNKRGYAPLQEYSRIQGIFRKRKLLPQPTARQGVEEYRTAKIYLAAAITDAQLPRPEADQMVENAFEYMAKLRQFHAEQFILAAIQDSRVRAAGRRYFEKFGRKVRRSLSPQKRDVPASRPLSAHGEGTHARVSKPTADERL